MSKESWDSTIQASWPSIVVASFFLTLLSTSALP